MPVTKATKASGTKKKGQISRKVGAKSKTHDPMCSEAMSRWKGSGTLTSDVAKILAKCRNKARVLRGQKGLSEKGLSERILMRSRTRASKSADVNPARTFGESRAKVIPGEGTNMEDVHKVFKDLTGKEYTDARLASLTGATDDATVKVRIKAPFYHESKRLALVTNGEKFDSYRIVQKDENGKLIISNEYLEVKHEFQGKGLGSEIFGRQVENARKMGFTRIKTLAGRSDNPSTGMNGYYTWPRLGYDAPLPPYTHVAKNIPSHIYTEKNADGDIMISSLMKTEEGRAYWKKHGDSTDMEFDLTPGSHSLQVHEFYLRNKKR